MKIEWERYTMYIEYSELHGSGTSFRSIAILMIEDHDVATVMGNTCCSI